MAFNYHLVSDEKKSIDDISSDPSSSRSWDSRNNHGNSILVSIPTEVADNPPNDPNDSSLPIPETQRDPENDQDRSHMLVITVNSLCTK